MVLWMTGPLPGSMMIGDLWDKGSSGHIGRDRKKQSWVALACGRGTCSVNAMDPCL